MSLPFRTRYNRAASSFMEFKNPSLTEQHHKDDCDLNRIMDRYLKTGVLDCEVKYPLFGDFTESASDFREAQDLIVRAREAFEALPSKLRDRFNNSPEQLMLFLDDPSNKAEAERLGLLATAADAPDSGARASRVPVTGAAEPGAESEASGEAVTNNDNPEGVTA